MISVDTVIAARVDEAGEVNDLMYINVSEMP